MERGKHRLNIGCVVDEILSEYEEEAWEAIISEAQGKDVNIFTFVGGRLHSRQEFDVYANQVYGLITPHSIDGFIILSSAIGGEIPTKEIGDFCKKCLPLPMVSIGLEIENIPSMVIDNKGEIKKALSHLIEDHGRRNIAFIRGPIYNPEAQERYEAYLEALAEHHIPVDENLIFVGNFLKPMGPEAVRVLLDERKAKFDAIMAANDAMALGAIEELKERGIRIPQDVAIVGFDDTEEAKSVNPPLTTIHQPYYDMGRKALEILLDLIEEKQVPQKVTFPTQLIIRQSCGCKSSLVIKAGERIELGKKSLNSFPQEEILCKMIESIEERDGDNLDLYPLLDDLLDSFLHSLKEKSPDRFIGNLEQYLLSEKLKDYPTEMWQKTIILLRQEMLPYVEEKEILFAENLFHQAHLLIGEIREREQIYKGLKILNETIRVGNISQRVISTFDFEKLSRVLTQELKKLKIPGCYIALYQEEGNFSQAQLSLAYNENNINSINYQEIKSPFPSFQLLPENLIHPFHRKDFLVQSLHFEDKILGYIVFELDSKDGFMYEILRGQISSAIYGAIIFNKYVGTLQELEKRVEELSILNEIGRAINSAMELDKLWELVYQQTSRLVDFQSFYIALYDKEKQELITVFDIFKGRRRKDREKSRPFAQGRTEYIIRGKKPLLAKGDVQKIYERLQIVSTDKEAKAFAGVPIIVKDKVIGVMAVQHYESNDTYDEHTIEILSLLANQLGIAIENARLFEEIKRLATTDSLTGVWNRRYLEESLHKEKERSERFGHPFSLLILDVDNLKFLNDTYGHLFGDEVIKTIARTIKSSCRKIDIIGRYGGDEFAVILPETNKEGAIKVSEKILSNIKSKSLTAPDGKKIPLSASIGIACYPLDAKNGEKLFSLADTAMYKAKAMGGEAACTSFRKNRRSFSPF